MKGKDDISSLSRREAIKNGAKLTAAIGVSMASVSSFVSGADRIGNTENQESLASRKPVKISDYDDPGRFMLPRVGVEYSRSKLALVVVNPQVDFLSPNGVAWRFLGASIREHSTVENIEALIVAAKAADIVVAVSPLLLKEGQVDKQKFISPFELFIRNAKNSYFDVGTFGSKKTYGNLGFMPEFEPYINDGKTLIATQHNMFGPSTNDLSLQLRRSGVSQVMLCGVIANLSLESHMRYLQEEGFEVCVVRDATAGPKMPEGDGYLSALINFRYLANDLVYTKEAIKILSK